MHTLSFELISEIFDYVHVYQVHGCHSHIYLT